MKGEYIEALETRARWLNWAQTDGEETWRMLQKEQLVLQRDPVGHKTFIQAWPAYKANLDAGDTFFMNREFCDMVEHAKQTIPEDFEYDNTWLQSRGGWCYLATPFIVPRIHDQVNSDLELRAFGWIPVTESKTYFLFYISFEDFGGKGFGCWSHFTLETGAKLKDRMIRFEQIANKTPGGYVPGKDFFEKHEMHWLYAALYLMAQKLAHHSSLSTDRHTRKRAQRMKMNVSPFLRIISLRRLEEEREKGEVKNINWRWRWVVRGHWRMQPYKDGVVKPVFIEAYVKGPESKPLKEPSLKLFVARK